jgi:hypothetical protein
MSDPDDDWKSKLQSCKNCGKTGPFDFCSKDCLEQFKQKKEAVRQPTPKSTVNLQEPKHNGNGFSDDLRDGAFQKGILWRKNKLLAINRARSSGIPDNGILRELRLGGITIQKARELMRDSGELLGRGESNES